MTPLLLLWVWSRRSLSWKGNRPFPVISLLMCEVIMEDQRPIGCPIYQPCPQLGTKGILLGSKSLVVPFHTLLQEMEWNLVCGNNLVPILPAKGILLGSKNQVIPFHTQWQELEWNLVVCGNNPVLMHLLVCCSIPELRDQPITIHTTFWTLGTQCPLLSSTA